MEIAILLLFAGIILFFAFTGKSIVVALLLGYLLFFVYAIARKYALKEILTVSFQGICQVKNILILFMLIGFLTAIWRSGATLPSVIYYASGFLYPKVVLLMCFLLNCLISALSGTSFGTAATMGVITMGIANSLAIHPLLSGGAIVSGIFFGDRCSPVSTSALLVAEITSTSIYRNIRNMMRTAAIPFVLSCGFYLTLGILTTSGNLYTDELRTLLASRYTLTWLNLLPAVIIVVFVLLHIDVKLTLLASIGSGVLTSIFVQHVEIPVLLGSLIYGYHAADPEIAALFDGGGILSMFRVAAIVCVSSTYAGLFKLTGLLNGITEKFSALAERTNSFVSVIAASIVTSIISCNQTLAILLTCQLCAPSSKDKEQLALQLENSAVLIAPLVPWSIAGAVPIAVIGASPLCLLFACYLYLVPVWNLVAFQNSPKIHPEN